MSLSAILWLTPPALQSCLAILLVVRGTYRRFRFFLAYTVFAVVAEASKFFFFVRDKDGWAYFKVAWGAEAVYAVLGFLAIYEVFRHVFENFDRLPWFKFLLPAVGVVMLGISILDSYCAPPVRQSRCW